MPAFALSDCGTSPVVPNRCARKQPRRPSTTSSFSTQQAQPFRTAQKKLLSVCQQAGQPTLFPLTTFAAYNKPLDRIRGQAKAVFGLYDKNEDGRFTCRAFAPQAAAESKSPVPPPDLNPEELVGAGWDPHGLLPPPTSVVGGHFARRERERQAKLQAAQQAARASPAEAPTPSSTGPSQLLTLQNGIEPVSQEHLANGGIKGVDRHLYDHDALEQRLQQRYMAVDLDFPGLRILHLDPFVCVVDSFWTTEQCNSFIQEVENSGQLQASKVGAGNVTNTTINAINNRRTSTSILVDPATEAAYPGLSKGVTELRSAAWKVLCNEGGAGWGKPGKMPLAKQYCYESLQVARYDSGQYFLSHDDAFPTRQAIANGFQRHATFLIYLNDVASGGATRFDHLGLSVQPKQGMGLLFFPAFSDGTPDARMLHTAMDAQDTKWIVQQWVARGWNDPTTASSEDLMTVVPKLDINPPSKRSKAKQPKQQKAAKNKGFGK